MLAQMACEAGLLSGMAEYVQSFAESPAAGIALFILAFAESSFFLIPPDVLLIALCLTDEFLASIGLTMWFAALCTIGSTAGGAFGYALGLAGIRPLVKRIASPEKLEAVERLLQRYDVWAIAAAGFTPIPYKVFTIASGLLRVNFVRFIIASVLSRGARFFLVAGMCFLFGAPVRYILENHLGWASVAFFVLLVGGFFLVKWLVNRYKNPERQDAPGPEAPAP